jgi:GTPase SAR1 family protein
MPHGHPDNFPDRGGHPNRRAFGRPTPRLNALINNTIEVPNVDNPGPAVVDAHRRSRAGLFELQDMLPMILEQPEDAQKHFYNTSSGILEMYDNTSNIINTAVANRGAVRRDLKNMENEKFEWPDE